MSNGITNLKNTTRKFIKQQVSGKQDSFLSKLNFKSLYVDKEMQMKFLSSTNE